MKAIRYGLMALVMVASVQALPAAAAENAPGPSAGTGPTATALPAVPAGTRLRVGSPAQLPAGAKGLGALAASTPMHAVVALQPRDPAALAEFAAAVSTPGDPAYRQYLRPGEFGGRFGAEPATIDATAAALRRAGLHVGPASGNGLSLPIDGTAASMGAAFKTSFARYHLADGRNAFANTAAPTLAAPVGAQIDAVIGLDSLRKLQRAQPATPARSTSQSAAAPAATPNTATAPGPQPCQAATDAATANNAVTADQDAAAYGLTPLYEAGAFGQGVRVAIYELEGNLNSDIINYQACYGTSTTVNYIPVDGGQPQQATHETPLDIEAIIGLAPQATIDVYQAPNTAASAYNNYSAIVTAGNAQVISTSWGTCDANMKLDPDLGGLDALFQQAAAQGQSIFAASGDSGSQCGQTLGVTHPASDPWVTGVGGTTLNAIGPRPSEEVWWSGSISQCCIIFGGASGGGISSNWPMPTYQSAAAAGLNVINAYSSPTPCGAPAGSYCRQVPDVSASASPDRGGFVAYIGGWTAGGGTSVAAPLWAAMTAVIDSVPACASRPVGFANPALYRAAATAYASNFNDVTVGNNNPRKSGPYDAGAGYDLATGLGTPNAAALADSFCPSPTMYVANHNANTVTPVSTTTRIAGTPIPVGTGPSAVAITPDAKTVYVANSNASSVTPIDTATNTAGTAIPVGAGPSAVAITPDGTTVYVANAGSDSVTPITTATNTAGTPIPVGSSPNGIAITPNGKTIYVSNFSSDSVTPIDTATNTAGSEITTGLQPLGLAIRPNGKTLYVANAGSSSVTPIDTATNVAGAPIAGIAHPARIAITPNGKTAYVTNGDADTVTPITTAKNTVGAPIPAGPNPTEIAAAPDGATVYVTNAIYDYVTPIDTATNVSGAPNSASSFNGVAGIAITPDQGPIAAFTATHGAGRLAMLFDASTSSAPGARIASYAWDFGDGTTTTTPDPVAAHTYDQPGTYKVKVTLTDAAGTSNRRVFTGQTTSLNGSARATKIRSVNVQPIAVVYVANRGSDSVAAVNVGGVDPIPVGADATAIVIAPSERTMYAGTSVGTVVPISIAGNIAGTPITLDSRVNALALTPNGQTLYAGTDSAVVPIDTATNTVGAPIPFDAGVNALAVAPDGNTLYVGAGSTVTPVDTATNTKGTAITMGGLAFGLTVAPNGNTVYVANYGGSTVTTINTATNTAAATISLSGQYPWSIAISPNAKLVYVADFWAGTVTPIDTATNIAGAPSPVGVNPHGIAFTPDGTTAYVSSFGTNTVRPIKTATNVVGPPISNFLIAAPWGIAIVPDQAPIAAFTATPAPVGQATGFDASASLAPGAPIAKYVWHFGDGTTVTTTTPTTTHVYATAGTRKVTLTVYDAAGTSTTTVFTGQTMSRNGSPTASIKVQITIPS